MSQNQTNQSREMAEDNAFLLAKYIDKYRSNGLIPAPDNLLDKLLVTDEHIPANFQAASRLLTRPYIEITPEDLVHIEALTKDRGDVLLFGGVKATWGNCDGGKFALMPLAESLTQQRFELQSSKKPEESGLEAARHFWRELTDSVDSLTAIADEHGSRTLADLMCLQNAILSGGFIDTYPGESSVMQIVSSLPSSQRWQQFVKIEYMRGN